MNNSVHKREGKSHVDVRGRVISERKIKQWTEVGECLRVFC